MKSKTESRQAPRRHEMPGLSEALADDSGVESLISNLVKQSSAQITSTGVQQAGLSAKNLVETSKSEPGSRSRKKRQPEKPTAQSEYQVETNTSGTKTAGQGSHARKGILGLTISVPGRLIRLALRIARGTVAPRPPTQGVVESVMQALGPGSASPSKEAADAGATATEPEPFKLPSQFEPTPEANVPVNVQGPLSGDVDALLHPMPADPSVTTEPPRWRVLGSKSGSPRQMYRSHTELGSADPRSNVSRNARDGRVASAQPVSAPGEAQRNKADTTTGLSGTAGPHRTARAAAKVATGGSHHASTDAPDPSAALSAVLAELIGKSTSVVAQGKDADGGVTSSRSVHIGAVLRMLLALVPILLAHTLVLACLFIGGDLVLWALAYVSLASFGSAEFIRRAGDALPIKDRTERRERMAVILAGLHIPTLLLVVFGLGTMDNMSLWGFFGVLLASAFLFGQFSLVAAHELLHSRRPARRQLGIAVYISVLCGPYAFAHLFVHHRFVATSDDPMTAEAGESFWMFVPRSWVGVVLGGYEIGKIMKRRRLGRRRLRLNPSTSLAALCLAVASLTGLIFGAGGLFVLLVLAVAARDQLLIEDYAGHYGLLRSRGADDKPEAYMPRHGWEAPSILDVLLGPSPSVPDHIAHPPRGQGPLPAEIASTPPPRLFGAPPVIALFAMLPPLWHRVMAERLRAVDWQRQASSGQDNRHSSGIEGAAE